MTHSCLSRYSLYLCTFFFCAILCAHAATPPPVYLPSCNATLNGTIATVTSDYAWANVHEYKGIPFALPPTNTRRFAATVDLTCPAYNSTFDATQFSNPCAQVLGGFISLGSEDCLYLNVFVPEAIHDQFHQRSTHAPQQLAPVVVYIHGGGLTQGSGVWESLQFLSAFAAGDDNASTAENSAIVVTINYRLAVLGFLATQSMCDETSDDICGNFGILDQMSALRWVQAHIASFGGDPTRVSLMGQSSGGTSIFALMAAESSSGLFHAAVSLSGSPNLTMTRQEKLSQDFLFVTQTLNCSGTGRQQLSCLRDITPENLQLLMPNSWNTDNIFSNQFLNNASAGEGYPALAFVDGVVIKNGLWQSIANGLNGDVALVFGNMGQECSLQPPSPSVSGLSKTEWKAFLEDQIFQTWPNASGIAATLSEIYAPAANVNPQLAYDSINADYGQTCASYAIINEIVEKIRKTRSASIYVYFNQYGPEGSLFQNGLMSYAYHMWDYINACHNWGIYIPGEEDRALSRLQRSQWFSVFSSQKMPVGWPAIDETGVPEVFLYSRQSRYPFRKTGSTSAPAVSPNACDYFINELGLNKRYWWVN